MLVHTYDKANWDKFQYLVFDSPKSQEPLTRRFGSLSHLLMRPHPSPHPFVKLAQFDVGLCKSHVENLYMSVLGVGGEGIIVRQPFSLYSQGYSHDIYKYKVCILFNQYTS
jgi:ATP-dependent DNA ligase